MPRGDIFRIFDFPFSTLRMAKMSGRDFGAISDEEIAVALYGLTFGNRRFDKLPDAVQVAYRQDAARLKRALGYTVDAKGGTGDVQDVAQQTGAVVAAPETATE